MTQFIDPYWLLILLSSLIIVSYVFELIAKKTNIPSVLMLMGTGILIQQLSVRFVNLQEIPLDSVLEIVGILGLIMIVLEAALDLKLSKEKWPMIWRAFAIAFVLLIITSFLTASVIAYFMHIKFENALLLAVPLSIMSSAIIIPSVGHLTHEKKEFMIYEATFSDILGIVFFYMIVDAVETSSYTKAIAESVYQIAITIVISVVLAYFLVYLLQKILKQVNYFLVFAILILVYAIGKTFHLSALIVILVFGIIVNNKNIFFTGRFKRFIDPVSYNRILKNMKIFTNQTAFLVRTYFFVIFGTTIYLGAFTNPSLYTITGIILVLLYLMRFINLNLFLHSEIFPELFIAPRGLITILLFFAIPEEYLVERFEQDLIFMIIIATNLIMMAALMIKTGKTDIKRHNPNV